MNPIDTLEAAVRKLYEAKDPQRNDWGDWLYEHHVFLVTDNTRRLAEQFGANVELAAAAAMLHDIADTKMSRFNEAHEEQSLVLGRQLMQEAGFGEEEISIVVDDAVRKHSCHDGIVPESLEGKVLATADALAHLQSDFYVYTTWALGREASLDKAKEYVLKKSSRDYNDKIQFDEIKQEARADYDRIQTLFMK